MGDKTVEILEGELGVQLKEAPPPKPVRLRKAAVHPSKKKKEAAPTSPRQVSKKAAKDKAKHTSNEHDDDGNPLEWITLNRCLFLAVLTIAVSTGVNSLNECLSESLVAFWEWKDAEPSAEELALGHGDASQDSTAEESESSLWSRLFWWRREPDYDCEADDYCDGYEAIEDYDGGIIDDDEAVDDDDDGDAVDGTVDDDDDDDDDDGEHAPERKPRIKPNKKRALLREPEEKEYTLKHRKRHSREPGEDITHGKRAKERWTRQRHGGEEEVDEEEVEKRPRRKRQKEEREPRRG